MQTAEEKLAVLKYNGAKKIGMEVSVNSSEEKISLVQLYRRALRIMHMEPMITRIRYEVIFHYEENPTQDRRGYLTVQANTDVDLEEKSYWDW